MNYTVMFSYVTLKYKKWNCNRIFCANANACNSRMFYLYAPVRMSLLQSVAIMRGVRSSVVYTY